MKFFVNTLAIMIFIFPLNVSSRSLTGNNADYLHLPELCRYTQWREPNVNVSILNKWKRKLGPDWIHVHHFCRGLNLKFHSQNTMERKQFARLSKDAIGEFSYIRIHASQNFSLMPITNVKIGELLVGLKRFREAEESFHEAIRLNPKFTPSYSELSKLYIKQKQKDKAKKTLLEGLKISPNSKLLKLNLNRINK